MSFADEKHVGKLSRRINEWIAVVIVAPSNLPPLTSVVSLSSTTKPCSKLGVVIHNDSLSSWYLFSFEFKLIEWHDIRVDCFCFHFVFYIFVRSKGKSIFLCFERDVARAKTWMINWELLEWLCRFSFFFLCFVRHLSLPRYFRNRSM